MPQAVPSLQPWGPGRRAAYGAALGLLLAAGLLLLRRTATVETFELRLVDLRVRAAVGDRPADPRIVLAVIGESDQERLLRSDLTAESRWPWSLQVHRRAMTALATARVRAVLVDVYHVERGKAVEDVTLSDEERQKGWIGTLAAEAADGDELSDAYRLVGRAALAFQLERRPTGTEQPARVEAAAERLLPSTVAFDAVEGFRFDHAVLPVNRVARGAALVGFANLEPSVDGVFRLARPAGWWAGRPVLSLPLAGAVLAVDGLHRVGPSSIRVGEAVQRLDEEQGFYLSYRGAPRRAYRTVPVADLVAWGMAFLDDKKTPADLAPEAKARFDQLADALVVYGASLAGAEDLVPTALSGSHLGPEVQATMLDNLLHGDGRVQAPRAVDGVILLVLCGLAGALGAWLKGRWLPHLPAAALLGLLVLGTWWRFEAGTVHDLFTPGLGLLLTWAAAGVLRLATEGRRNRWLEGTFSRYVSAEVVEALKKDPTLLALGGRRRELTVLFSDVAGFTSLSEKLPPEQVVRLLNRYLTTQSEEVMATGGVIDKFEGDAVMAFWGDPIESPDHALRAVKAALRCLGALPGLAPLLRELGVERFDIRIGLNSGPALVGNMGSEARLDYTCMGDNVNLASRLEGANKAFASRLLIGPVTYLLVKDHVLAKRLADLVVVGRSNPVRVYEVLSLREDADEDTRAHAGAFARAHEALRQGDLAVAWEALAEAEARRPGDGPTAWLRSLAARLRRGEAPSPWDGTWRLTEK